MESLDFHIEVTGAGDPITAVVRINIDYENHQEWTVTFIAEAVGKAERKAGVDRRDKFEAAAQATDDEIAEQDARALERLSTVLPPEKMTNVKAGRLRNVTLGEALGWAVYGKWGKPFHGTPFTIALSGGPKLPDLLSRVTNLAGEGKLTIWGKRDDPGYYEQIPRSHWQDKELTTADIFGSVVAGGENPYRNLMLNDAEVEREWPHEG